ncbi:MAG: restriction endonuclease, partial [Nitrosopumilus sp.]|nr:restriction endonuclease [Nitrosopumilus sp.]
MIQKKSSIVVFEHESLRMGEGEKSISKDQLKALQIFYGEKGVPYFSLIHNGVKFNEHVGVIQVGNSII